MCFLGIVAWLFPVLACLLLSLSPAPDPAPDPAGLDLQQLVVGGCDSRALGVQQNPMAAAGSAAVSSTRVPAFQVWQILDQVSSSTFLHLWRQLDLLDLSCSGVALQSNRAWVEDCPWCQVNRATC